MTVAEFWAAVIECQKSNRGDLPHHVEVTFSEWDALNADKMFQQAYGFDKISGRETLFGIPIHVGHREFTLVLLRSSNLLGKR